MRRFAIAFSLFLLIAAPTLAQSDPCPAVKTQALASLASVCHDLGENSACYGHNRVSALFTEDLAPVAFSKPGDHLTLDVLQNISTSGFDGTAWGIVGIKLSDAYAVMTGDAHFENNGQTGAFTLRTDFKPAACADTPSLVALLSPEDEPVEWVINSMTMRLNRALVVFQQQSANSLAVIVQRGQLEIVGTGTAQSGQTLVGVTDNKGRVLFWSAPRPINVNESQAAQLADDIMRQWQTAESAAENAATVVEVPAETSPILEEAPSVVVVSNDAICSHTVSRGETLYRIATRYGTTVQTLDDSNRIANVNLLSIGQQLTVPCSGDIAAEVPTATITPTQSTPPANTTECGEHIVSSGDNLYRLSLRYGTSVEAIAAANRLSNPRLIYSGQRLVIPCK